MAAQEGYSRHVTVSAGKWRLQVGVKELREVLPSLAAFSKALKLRNNDKDSTALQDATDFLQYLDQISASDRILAIVGRVFEQHFLQDNDIHSLANDLEPSHRKALLRLSSKYCSLNREESRKAQAESGLIEAAQNGTASILAVFGGQGLANNSCLSDLRVAADTYGPLAADLIEAAAQCLASLAADPRAQKFFDCGEFDLKAWLEDPLTAPDHVRLAQAPISFPMIGLLSLVQYCVALKAAHLTPQRFRKALKATTGHSQGIIAAAVIAISDSWSDFQRNAVLALKTLFWIGLESHSAAPQSSLSSRSSLDSEERHEGIPSHMLSVRGVNLPMVQKYIQETNRNLAMDQQIHVALKNNISNFVVAGPPRSLVGFREDLLAISAADELDQSRVPYLQRKPVISCSFLPISAPFHSPYLLKAALKVMDHIQGLEWLISSSPVPVISTSTGKECHASSSKDLMSELVRMVMVEPVDWLQACLKRSASHILDFGPGKSSLLLRSSIEGSSTRAIILSETQVDVPNFLPHTYFYTPSAPSACRSWRDEYQPRRGFSVNHHQLDTKMTRMLGGSPLMVAGMTPTTACPIFVSAILKAGYHAELAGGGYSDSKQFEQAIRTVVSELPINRGLTCNIIYVNPRQVAWQIPLIKSLIAKGVRIGGLTIGGAVPSIDIASEWIKTLGVRHVSFKPGSTASIKQVLEIADQNPTFPIGLQWTGGRAGGHHSYEDFHEPMLKMYGAIRRRKNIILIAGGGFGDADGVVPYLTGHWSATYHRPYMPFDGVLLGSRVMAAKEAKTSDAVKELMAQASGCPDAAWHQSYIQSIGGVLTVLSEMGQPIHVLSNRAMLFWKDMDDRIFSVKDSTSRLKKLAELKQSIVARLNSDFAKPWFATLGGQVVEIEDMTYQESLERLIQLMYIPATKSWIDPSYKTFVKDWAERIAQRLAGERAISIPNMDYALEDLEIFLTQLSSASTTRIYSDDVSFFMNLCRRRGQKPVNFVPRLDSDFETWFKKDSLWQSENLEAVPDQDPQKVFIIYGPVAAQYTMIANEPIAMILDGINADLTTAVSSTLSAAEQSSPKTKDDTSAASVVTDLTHTVTKEDLQSGIDCFLEKLIPADMRWTKTCLFEKYIMRGEQAVENPVRLAFNPQFRDEIVINRPVSGDQCIVLKPDSNRKHASRRQLQLECADDWNLRMTLTSPKDECVDSVLDLKFELREDGGAVTIHETTKDREESIRGFYAEIWACNLIQTGAASVEKQQDMMITRDLVQDYLTVIGASDRSRQTSDLQDSQVPFDVCIVVAWQALMQGLLGLKSQGNLFRLLHRSAEFEYQPACSTLTVGDRVKTSSRVVGFTTSPSGRSVTVSADISRGGRSVVKVTCEFFIQGTFGDSHTDFRHVEEPSMLVKVDSLKLQALLRSRTWFQPKEPSINLLGTTLVFKLETSIKKSQIVVTGPIAIQSRDGSLERIGGVRFDQNVAPRNPVMDFLERHGMSEKQVVPLQQPGWRQGETLTLQIPKAGDAYSRISLDRNPIHTCPYFASFAGLSRPITHGMFTSAAVRRMVERSAADADCSRFRRWSCSFDAMVYHGQTIEVKIEHTAMVEGRMLLQVTASEAESKEQVLHAQAEVEQSATAYVFCGQGSQEKAMGMSLYNSDRIAKDIWDRGNKHLSKLYGKQGRTKGQSDH